REVRKTQIASESSIATSESLIATSSASSRSSNIGINVSLRSRVIFDSFHRLGGQPSKDELRSSDFPHRAQGFQFLQSWRIDLSHPRQSQAESLLPSP
ncbi:hypothetical protein Dimus_001298, partial [Dionaea muscipula]